MPQSSGTDSRVKSENVAASAHRLIAWYRVHARSLPWRETVDPYAIWVSETMLQQTRVDTVIPYYHEFLAAFPTVRALAMADEQFVLKHWQGLGYYSRARNLQRAARDVVARHDGVIPADPDAFRELAGGGPYTCGAVMSIAFGLPVAAVDGNVLRVLARYLGLHDEVGSSALKTAVSCHVDAWLQHSHPPELTQAVMELGALVCVPGKPQCGSCPLADDCVGLRTGTAAALPVRAAKKPRRATNVLSVWYETADALLMEQRAADGLLADMWQLPSVECAVDAQAGVTVPEASAQATLRQAFAYLWDAPQGGTAPEGTVLDFACMGQAKHVFTHLEWHVTVWRPTSARALAPAELAALQPRLTLIRKADLHRLPVPRVYEKLLQLLLQET